MNRTIAAVAALLLSLGALGACSAPQEADPMTAVDPVAKAVSLELDQPITEHFDGADSPRHRYLIKVLRSGLMVINLTWNNPEGINRMVIQAGAGEMNTVDVLTQQEITHSMGVDPGYYTLELIPGPAPVSYNLLASLR